MIINKIIDIVTMLGLGCTLYTCVNALGEEKRMNKAELIGKLKGVAIANLDDCTGEDKKVEYMATMVDYYKKIVDEELKKEHKTLREKRVAKAAKKLKSELAWMGFRLSVAQMLCLLVNTKACDETEEHFEEWKSEKMKVVIEKVNECVEHYTEYILPMYGEFLSLIK